MHKSIVASLLALSAAQPALAGGRLVFMNEDDQGKRIIMAKADGSDPQALTPEGEWSLYPDISADGRFVAYSRGSDEAHLGIVVKDLTRNVLEQWTAPNGMYLHSDLSADGRYLAFSGPIGRDNAQRIGVVDLQEARVAGPVSRGVGIDVYRPTVQVLESADAAYFPALSSSGTFVVFQRNVGTSKYIVRRDLLSGDETLLTAADGYAMAPTLSSDDRYLAYTQKVDDQWELYLKDLSTNTITQLTHTAFRDYAPAFRPDGGLVYAADPSGSFQLYEIPAAAIADGSYTARALPAIGGDAYAPSISGDLDYLQSTLPAIPNPGRSSFGAISHRGLVFVAGGHTGPEHTYPPESFSDRLDIYDPATKQWHQGASLTMARHGFSLAAYNGFIYTFGGFTYSADHTPGWKSVDLVERYDIAQDRWEVVGHLPRPRSSNVVAQVGTKVYLIGGWDSTPQFANDFDGRFHDAIDVYDLLTDTASTLTTRLQAPLRRALSGVVLGNEVLLVGGIGVGGSHFELLDNVTAFNTVSEQFHELQPLPFPTFAPAAGLLNGKLFVFGGMFKTGDMAFDYVNHVYELSLSRAGKWTHTGRHLQEMKGFSQVVNLGANTLGILGGHTYVGDEDHPIPTFETFGERTP